MRDWKGKRYWLVGASAGLGSAVAKKLSRMGVELVLSARSEDALNELRDTLPGRSRVVTMDVQDTQSVKDAAEAAGEIDGLVFCAGVYWPMPAQKWDAEKITAMADINFTGAVRVVGEVLPTMVARDRGHIVLTGSLSGFRGLPGTVGYGASKAGVMYLAESLHADLKDSGVDVQLVNPGFIRTRLTDKNDFEMPMIMEPDAAAEKFFDHMNDHAFKRNFPGSLGAILRGSQFLPDWAYYRIFA